MWGTVLFLGLVSATEPTRIAIAAILIGLRRPFLNLLMFWVGLLISGAGLALAAQFLLHDYLPHIVQVLRFAAASPAIPPIKIAFGVLAISVAATLVIRSKTRQAVLSQAVLEPVPVPVGGPAAVKLQSKKPSMFSPAALSRLWIGIVEGGSAGMAFIAGMATSCPPIEFWGAVLAILASGAPGGMQVTAFLMFMLVAYAIAELPLLCYVAAPAKTRIVVTRLHGWLRAHRRPIFLWFMSAFGALMITGGVGGL